MRDSDLVFVQVAAQNNFDHRERFGAVVGDLE
jgi:hypothetical protein